MSLESTHLTRQQSLPTNTTTPGCSGAAQPLNTDNETKRIIRCFQSFFKNVVVADL